MTEEDGQAGEGIGCSGRHEQMMSADEEPFKTALSPSDRSSPSSLMAGTKPSAVGSRPAMAHDVQSSEVVSD